MADVIFGLLGDVLSRLGSHAVQEIGSAMGVKKELKKLEKTLSTISAVFMDADEQQLNSHELTNWFKLMKDAKYEAEDIIDDFSTEALRQKLRIKESSMKKVCSFAYSIKSAALSFKMSRRIKEVRQKFDEIAAEKDKFHLIKSSSGKREVNAERGQTYAFVAESEVFGRNDDKDEIVELLCDEDGESVVAIIGMGGLGKTTLAQLVHNDKTVKSKFETRLWVSVYQEFDVRNITEKMIKSATDKECPNLEMDQLQSLLRKHLTGKKYLLVLDDVWNEDSEKWDKLKFLLSDAAKGSKVVVTTRSAKVASIMGARSYSLKVISDNDCWNLFKERAFEKGDAEKQPNLVAIGKEMVNKCHGVPLAAKTLGSLMRFKTLEHEWVSVNNNDVWRLAQNDNDILPALRLSYDHLPFHLKQCFALSAIAPKGILYEVNVTIETWTAQGYLHSVDKNQCLEDVGYEYVKELLWRSLFSEPVEDSYGNITGFKIHDLVYNLAQEVAGTEFSFPEKVIDLDYKEEIRHLNLLNYQDSLQPDVVCKIPNLRSLYLHIEYPADDIFSNFNCLRDLTMIVTNGSVPSSIGKLKHLRFLGICSTVIETLPKSTTKLLNLQTLELRYCTKLKELPQKMERMINLRHIHIADDASIPCMPGGLRNLASLQSLTLFAVGKGIGSKLNELQGLIHLKGELIIKNLHNVSSAMDCAGTNLKQRLQALRFIWADQEGEGEKNGKESIHVDVLEALHPHSNIRSIKLEGYGGSAFPRWLMESLFPKLVDISLVKCGNCESLPPFGRLPSLKFLKLKDMDSLRCIEGNGVADRRQAEWFPSLKELSLERIPNLESWVLGEETSAMLSLACVENLEIIDCPKLRSMPLLPFLKKLLAEGCNEKLVHSTLITPNSPCEFLYELKIKRCDDLESLSGLHGVTRLEILIIEECPRLVHLPGAGCGCLNSLVKLEILKVPKLVAFPQWVQNATKLRTLMIAFCQGLIHLPDSLGELTSLRQLAIMGCHQLQLLPDGIQELTALDSLHISGKGLMSWPIGLENLSSLRGFLFDCSDILPIFPEQLCQMTWLQELGIGNCQTLPVFIMNFTSLQTLGVRYCNNMQCLPEWLGKITTLKHLYIFKCEQLTSRCRKESGEDWHKIAHIPLIKVNGETIQKK